MSWFKDWFSKFSKANSPISGAADQRMQQAADELLVLLDQHFQTTFESHPTSILIACVWLAGASLFRSFHFPNVGEPGQPVLSDRANELGPVILGIYFSALPMKIKMKLDPADLAGRIPAEEKPKLDLLTTQKIFQDSFHRILKKYKIDLIQGAKIGMIVCSRLTEKYCLQLNILDPKLAALVVSIGLVEGSKTRPLPL